MRHTAVYTEREEGGKPYVDAVRRAGVQFENLFRQLGKVRNGFVEQVDLAALDNAGEYDPLTIRDNLVFGTPDEVIDKLRRYEALGVDNFLYRASFSQSLELQKTSLRLFVDEVMPAFRDARHMPQAAE